MSNEEVREYAKQKRDKLWQIANASHINDGNFSKKLRVEFTKDKKQEMREIIDRLAAEQGW